MLLALNFITQLIKALNPGFGRYRMIFEKQFLFLFIEKPYDY
jgi:hypothetical protein